MQVSCLSARRAAGAIGPQLEMKWPRPQVNVIGSVHGSLMDSAVIVHGSRTVAEQGREMLTAD
jgi:hypothetical protein